MVGGLDDAGLASPSACEGWSVADLLLHLPRPARRRWPACVTILPAPSRRSGGVSGDDVDAVADQAVTADRGAPAPRCAHGGTAAPATWSPPSTRPTRRPGSGGWSGRWRPAAWPRPASPTRGSTPGTSPTASACVASVRPHPPHRVPRPPDDPLRVHEGGTPAGRPGPLRGHRDGERRDVGLRRRRRGRRRDGPGRRPVPRRRPARPGGRHRPGRHRARRSRPHRPPARSTPSSRPARYRRVPGRRASVRRGRAAAPARSGTSWRPRRACATPRGSRRPRAGGRGAGWPG